MTYYEKEVVKIKEICYSNQGQIDTVIGTRNYINNNFENDLNLDLLSRIQLTSKYHLLRLFKKYYGLTPKQYIIEKRIEKSKTYLKEGMTSSQTCFAVGFESPGSFSTLFKNRIGLTPTQFQKKQLSRRDFRMNVQTCNHFINKTE